MGAMTPLIFLLLTSLETKVDQVVSIFENGTPEIQYCYIENIHDGRGYTAGKAGFTTATGDFYVFTKNYAAVNPATGLKKYLPELEQLADHESQDTSGLRGIIKAWKSECRAADFEKAQDDLVETMYKRPAREYVEKYGLKTPLAYLIIYDSIIQHGDGDDPDSLSGIFTRMRNTSSEKAFLSEFLRARESVLLNATDESTRVEWKKSVDRVYALRKVLEAGNFQLEKIEINVWGESWKLP